MKIRISFILLLAFFKLSAQNDGTRFVNDTSKIDLREYFFSSAAISPCYSSERLKQLMPQQDIFKRKEMDEEQFNKLTAYEHFVHSFYYPEWYYQSCSMFGYPNNVLQTIPAELKRQGEGFVMSRRQMAAITQYRDSTIILMQKCIDKKNELSDEFKKAIINLRAFELIPAIITTIENQKKVKDPYLLTTLCLLMRFNYEPFSNSYLYKELYPSVSNENFISGAAYKKSIPFTIENYKQIIKWAKAYYDLESKSLSEFVEIPGGIYQVGEKGHSFNPLRKVEVRPFQISRYEISNEQFKLFVKNTGYITLAEKNKNAFVFRLGLDEFEWIQDSTANWRFPNGISNGGIDEKMNHPVTCISYVDALAYCEWANVRLPTIEEWEVASRGNASFNYHYFGDSLNLIYKHANIWHGKTHLMKYDSEDYVTTSPVGSFQPNPFGLYDIYGNVFEFCSNIPEAFNKLNTVAATRGGSWWCSMYACGFFNSIDIGRVQKEASFSNNGFRVVL